jgi:hypothetical protein
MVPPPVGRVQRSAYIAEQEFSWLSHMAAVLAAAGALI